MPPESSQPALSSVKEAAPQVPRVQLRQTAPVVLGKRPGEANRNLALGLGAVVLAAPLAGIAFAWAPREAFVAVSTSLILALLMFLALQLQLLIQRHGIFVLLSVGLLLTLAVPVGVRLGSTSLDWMSDVSELRAARSGQPLEGSGAPVFVQGSAKSVSAPVVNARQTVGTALVPSPEPVAPGAQPPPPPSALSATPAPVQASSAAVSPPAASVPVQENFSPEAAKRAEQALLEQLLAKLSREDPQTATRMAQKEMQRRYPALEDPASKEANLYREAYNELGRLRKYEFFKDPVWPLKIAEMLASREGWKRADLTAPAPVASLAVEAAPAEARPLNAPAPSAAPVPAASPKALPGEELALDGPQAPPAEDSHSQEVKRAMIEARRRYPAIGIEGSEENRAYVEVYEELDKLRPDFFSKGDWPIRLVELVAKREGWKRAAESKSAAAPEGADLPLPK